MKYIVKRYSLHKDFIATGELNVEEDRNIIELTYVDADIKVAASEPNNPFTALVSLRKKLEAYYNSTIAINGCRIDTAYMGTPTQGTYIIKNGKPSTRSIGMFEPTTEVDKLCTIEEHEIAYDKWLESIMAE